VIRETRAFDAESLCDARLATHERASDDARRYTITEAGEAYLSSTRPTRKTLEERLSAAEDRSDRFAAQDIEHELEELDRAKDMERRRAARQRAEANA
jgi:DNA-binding PadR family transcriptional regulator